MEEISWDGITLIGGDQAPVEPNTNLRKLQEKIEEYLGFTQNLAYDTSIPSQEEILGCFSNRFSSERSNIIERDKQL